MTDDEVEAVARALFEADEDLNDAHEAELRMRCRCTMIVITQLMEVH